MESVQFVCVKESFLRADSFASNTSLVTDGGRCEGRMGGLVVGQNIGFFVICDNAIL